VPFYLRDPADHNNNLGRQCEYIKDIQSLLGHLGRKLREQLRQDTNGSLIGLSVRNVYYLRQKQRQKLENYGKRIIFLHSEEIKEQTRVARREIRQIQTNLGLTPIRLDTELTLKN
jgi:hypothetical protein